MLVTLHGRFTISIERELLALTTLSSVFALLASKHVRGVDFHNNFQVARGGDLDSIHGVCTIIWLCVAHLSLN